MITGWPSSAVIFGASMRAVTSEAPPAAKPTTILIGFAGYCCALRGRYNAKGRVFEPQIHADERR
jgi:hypothetical protein